MANKPNIRFKGFTDDWEQRKLGEVIKVCNGRDYKHLDVGKIPVYVQAVTCLVYRKLYLIKTIQLALVEKELLTDRIF